MAVKELKNKKLIPENSVFVPGHSGDMLGGSQGPKKINIKKIYILDNATKYLLKFNCILHKHKNKKVFISKIKNSLYQIYTKKILNPEEYVNLIESYILSNKVAKFVINSVRVYEFFDYKWRIPLWDIELVSFWLKIPLKYRLKNELYNEYLMKLFGEYNIDFKKNKKYGFISKIKKIIKKTIPKELADIYYEKLDYQGGYRRAIKLYCKKNKIKLKNRIKKTENSYMPCLQIKNIKDKNFKKLTLKI